MEKMLVSGVACDKNVARIAVVGLEDQPGVAFKLFRHLANHNVNVDMILQSIGRDNTKDITSPLSSLLRRSAIRGSRIVLLSYASLVMMVLLICFFDY